MLAYVFQEEAEGAIKSREERIPSGHTAFEQASDLDCANAFCSIAHFNFDWVDGMDVKEG
ncbi:hypothetical protein [Helicobacter heilmannii]|uniref:hypothetical protein n=1 Tax=Helicobacter heilmannii TaxID=35817 RepID=UPI0006B333B2|nr:hypothetical protein [Helicobacter heilmannii]GMB95085.1 hypothetical protein NHP21011_11830 [Helicobacter heilmannii]